MPPSNGVDRFEARTPDGTGENFSTYEDYDNTSNHYDMARVPVALEPLYGGLLRGAYNSKSLLSQSRVLEMGCGTGAYTELVARDVKFVFLPPPHRPPPTRFVAVCYADTTIS
jgi:2-polyprenyl-3-methyl-5-hydroxy-6-metoxy-1,4-benzoquinol methylase